MPWSSPPAGVGEQLPDDVDRVQELADRAPPAALIGEPVPVPLRGPEGDEEPGHRDDRPGNGEVGRQIEIRRDAPGAVRLPDDGNRLPLVADPELRGFFHHAGREQ